MFKGAGANILRGVAGAGVLSLYDKLQQVMFGKVYSGGDCSFYFLLTQQLIMHRSQVPVKKRLTCAWNINIPTSDASLLRTFIKLRPSFSLVSCHLGIMACLDNTLIYGQISVEQIKIIMRFSVRPELVCIMIHQSSQGLHNTCYIYSILPS